jgi:hypothetical protein
MPPRKISKGRKMSNPTQNHPAAFTSPATLASGPATALASAPLPTETPYVSIARVPTKSALRYLGQLCKHFGHKVPSSLDGDHGWIAFEFGRCHLAASDDELSLHNTAASLETLQRLEEVIARHLERFAFREKLTITWQREA